VTHLCKCNGVADLIKTHPLPYVLTIIKPNVIILGQTCKIGVHQGHAALGSRAWLTTWKQDLPHVCYHAELGCSALKGVGKIQQNPKIEER